MDYIVQRLLPFDGVKEVGLGPGRVAATTKSNAGRVC